MVEFSPPYLSSSSTIPSSWHPPKTLNLLRLHTWTFSNFPKVMAVTTAGRDSLRVMNCGGVLVSEDQRDPVSDGRSWRMFLKMDDHDC